jgi:aspartate racemase
VKKPGIVGGIGPESTVDYYKMLIELCTREYGTFPEILVYSIDMNRMLTYVEQGEFKELCAYLLDAVEALGRAGADFALIASNTPHVVFKELQSSSPLELISIVKETCNRARYLGLKKLALLGTKFTMQESFYPDEFREDGIELVVPGAEEIEYIHEKIMNELEKGIVKDETKTRFLDIIEQMKHTSGVQGVILGCTELPIMFPDDELGISFLNTSKIHVESAYQRMVNGEK